LPEEAEDIYIKIKEEFENLNLKGVMSIGALSQDKKVIQKSFEDTYRVFDRLKKHGALVCSMGMSGIMS